MRIDPAQLEAVFGEALTKADAAARDEYLDQACGDNAELRERVEALLAAHAAAGDFLKLPDADPTADYSAGLSEAPGSRIGRYKLLQQIGEGGFGVVFMAEQEEPVRRKVALKIIKLGMDTRQVVARFEAERQALAIMDHPNIAGVIDAGATETGRPYFVMELVHGVPITSFCDDNHLSPTERLALFVPVCLAIQHAHQKGIIHRDIKPSNILVTLYDGKPVPKVIDFGVAKATEQRLTERTMFTQFGTIVGTPQYMSPEQAELSQLGVDTRSDVYSMGVVLYELLTGSTPLERKRLNEAAFAEMLRIIREEEPPRPSARLTESGDALAAIAANRHTEPAKLSKLLRGELDWIVMKALEKDRSRRYESASGLARDVERYLSDDPVEACPPSAGYRLAKFARKHGAALITVAAFAALLVAGAAVSVWQALRATEAQHLADKRGDLLEIALDESKEERRLAQAVSDYLLEAFRKPDPEQDGRDLKVVDLLDQSVAKLETEFTGSVSTKGELLRALGMTYLGLGLPEKAVPVLEKARAVLGTALGAGHHHTLIAMNDLAVAYRVAGRLDEAVPLSEEALKLLRAQLGPDDPDTILAIGNLADAYRDAGRADEALPLSEESLKQRRKALGSNDHETLLSMSNLAQTYQAAGRWAEAQTLLEETLKLRKAKSGPSHPAVTTSWNCCDKDINRNWQVLDFGPYEFVWTGNTVFEHQRR